MCGDKGIKNFVKKSMDGEKIMVKKLFFIIFLIFSGAPLYSAEMLNTGRGFLFPDTGSLGAGKNRVSFTDIIIGVNYAHGVSDYFEIEAGELILVVGEVGFKVNSKRIGNLFMTSLTGKIYFYPGQSLSLAGVGILSFSFESEVFKVTWDIGAGTVGVNDANELNNGYGSSLLFQFNHRGKVSFLIEPFWITKLAGFTLGPRVRFRNMVIDFGFLFPFVKDYETWKFIYVFPIFNLNLLF